MAKFNLFEGSRRIALLLKIVWVVGVAFFTYDTRPFVLLHFNTLSPTDTFHIGKDDCQSGTDRWTTVDRTIDDSKSISIELCFKSRLLNDQRRLVPYKVMPDGSTWGDLEWSKDVGDYIEARAELFRLSDADRQVARDEWRRGKEKTIRDGVLIAIAGWIAMSVFQAVVGWIVRGFLGIPRRQDHRSEATAQIVEVE